ncbi:MAG: tryptophan--tRNA ligase [Chloroflexi bacterium]|nr:tryptophan--tRNA ligase [Chloroflexota bacterium]
MTTQTKTTFAAPAPITAGKRRVFSGIQPSGEVQLGNYLGAIKGWVERQEEKINFFCLVDLHAITVYQDPEELRNQTRSLAAVLFAAGLHPDKSTVFVQSHVAAHAESCWVLNCVTPMGWLARMTQFKEKADRVRKEQRYSGPMSPGEMVDFLTGRDNRDGSISAGLFDYPVLMAGDILLYDTHEVPVGDDQRQHVELARDIAIRFNRIYGDTFVVPEPMIPEIGARVMGMNDPTVKMSKSYAHIRGHAVRMLDEPKEIERTIKRAVTDSGSDIVFSDDPEKAGVNNLLGIYKVITDKSQADVVSDFADARGYGDLKSRVAEVVIDALAPIQQRYYEFMDDPAELDRMLARGAESAAAVATPKMDELKRRVGFVLPPSQ